MKKRLFVALCAIIAACAAGTASASPKVVIVGTANNDTIVGTAGADVIYGRAGNDTLAGRDGDDRLYGGPGADKISCGSGVDVVFADQQDAIAKDCESVKVKGVTCNIDIKVCVCSDGSSHPISWCKRRHCGHP